VLVRKTVTALFCDLTDSTGLGEHLDPETHRRVITRYFDEMRAIIERHGGTVEKFIGDAVMALFGIPQVREDDALRAVRAAAEMRDRIAELGDELQALHGVRLDVSIGVNTGEVVAGGETVGGTLATGDAINVAARLQQAAGPGEILIGKATYPLVSNAITAGPLQRFKVKGKREEVSTWRLETVDAGASGFARRLDTPIVDREYELRELLQAFDRVTEEGACRLVTVLGPAGIGKSRLFGELLSVLDERASALTGRCLPYGDGITFWPLAQMVRALGGPQQLDVVLRDARDATAIADRVRGAIGAGPPGGAPEETFWAVRRLFEELARRRPLVVCVEDVHWAEPTFLDLLEYLVGWTREAPVLLVCLARPDLLEARASWLTPQPNTTVLSLEPLSETDADALVETLGGSAPLSKAARERIARAAEGNPLFVEQMVALAAEDGDGGDGAGGVPPSIQALLGERLDRLPAGERAVVERAAVAGREFFREAVVELSPAELRPSVTSALLALVRKGLVSPDVGSEEGEDGFRFRHALIRDAAYGALPREERAELHERFADWVERTMPARAVELEEIVGYHLEQAHAARAALAYDDEHTRALAARGAARLRAAGMRASARGDVSAAVTLLTRATVLLRDDDAARVELAPELAYALSETGELQQAGSVLDQALETARTLGNRCVEARTLVERSYLQLHTEPSAWPEALPTAERAIDLLESVGDDAGLARAWTLVVLVHYVRGRVSQLEVAAARALEHGRRADDRRAVSTVLNALVRAALIGPLPVAEAIDRCERLAAEVPGDRTLEAVAASARSNLEAMRGRFDEARRLYSEALATLEDLGLVRMLAAMRAYSAETELYAGDAAAAERELRAGIRTLEEIGDRGNLATHEALLARVLLEQGKADDAREATLSSERMASAEDIFSQVDWRGTRARLLAREGDVAAASVLAEEAVAIAAETDHVDMQGLALSALADVLAARGDTARAAETLAAAVARFETKGNEVWAAAARRRLADLSV
jgi:class 3 adenylate cyclase/tetratricopeptide (TPR) repeat protein